MKVGTALTIIFLLLVVASVGVAFIVRPASIAPIILPNGDSANLAHDAAQLERQATTPTAPIPTPAYLTVAQVEQTIRTQATLVTVQHVAVRDVVGQTDWTILGLYRETDTLLLRVRVVVSVGVDLQQLQVTSDGDGDITLTLPPSQVTNVETASQVIDRATGRLMQLDSTTDAAEIRLEEQTRAQAVTEMVTAACQADVMTHAAEQAQQALTRLAEHLQVKSVRIVATAGACQWKEEE